MLLCNVLGLTTGITFALVIGVFVWSEMQVNQQLKDVDRLYIFDGRDSKGNWTGFFARAPWEKSWPKSIRKWWRIISASTERMVKFSHNDQSFYLLHHDGRLDVAYHAGTSGVVWRSCHGAC